MGLRMASPYKHKKSRNRWFRKVTPKDIWDTKDRLAAMGLRVTREVHRSLETAESRAAKREQSRLTAEWEKRWQLWRGVLERGPVGLSAAEIVDFKVASTEKIDIHQDVDCLKLLRNLSWK